MVKGCSHTPVITLYYNRIRKYIDEEPSEILKWIPWIGVDIEEETEDYIKIEYNPNRPDFGTLIGLLRTYKGIRGIETGIIRYNVLNNYTNGYVTYVDEKIKRIRPYIATLVVKDLPMDKDLFEEIIEFQEDLHIGIGRRRRKISIGIHNLDVIKFPLRYTAVDKNYKFIPLDMDKEMSIWEILNKHPKGIQYGYILKDSKKYPLLVDSKNMVLSFPPIINGIYTKVNEETRNLFIDVTGTDYNTVIKTVDIIATTLADYGGKIYRTKVEDTELGIYYTPLLKYNQVEVSIEYINKILGMKLDLDEIIKAIRISRLDVKKVSQSKLIVEIPPYRVDILHPVDIVEEVAIGYGFWRIEPELKLFFTTGKEASKTKFIEKIADLMAGLGFQETIHSHLTDPTIQYEKMNKKPDEFIEVEHPKTLTHRILRTWIIPQLLETLSISQKEEYPQKIFEIGMIFTLSNIEGRIHLASAITHSNTNYNEIKAVLDTLMEIIEIRDYRIKKISHPSFITGRVGLIEQNNKDIGLIGEIHPEVLLNFHLEKPVVVFEIDLSIIMKIKDLKNIY